MPFVFKTEKVEDGSQLFAESFEKHVKNEDAQEVKMELMRGKSKAALRGKPDINFQGSYSGFSKMSPYCNWIHPHLAEIIFEENRQLLNCVKEVKRRERRRVKLLLKKIQSLNALFLLYRNPGALSHEKPFNCARCSKNFSTHFNFLRHIRTHTGERPYKCDLCFKMFGTKWHLSRHHLIHKRPFKCTHCNRTFAYKHRLSKHLGSTHLKCSHCSRIFAKKSQLQNHLRDLRGVSGTQVWSCKLCSKTFVRKFHLQRHMRIHTNEKPFTCPKCTRSFSRKDYLRKHILIHKTRNARTIKLRELTYSILYQARRIQMFGV